MEENYDLLKTNYPFLSLGEFRTKQLLGVIQNQNKNFINIYVYNDLKTPEHKKEFLKLAQHWWWQSNRQIPIDIFIGQQFKPFRYVLRSLNLKEYKQLFGPVVSTSQIIQKRIKRKHIQLIKSFTPPDSI